jgi:eukaryotic-like serine/threonine-protein kinase
MPLEINSVLFERYRILAELARGGMGAVYRGYDQNLGVEVAIKENLFVSPEFERQFKREATLLASLRHPNLPRVTDHFVIPNQGQYLVMDFIAGQDARQMLEENNGPLPPDKVIRWGREILSALNYLHSRPQPIVHRDIKPGNIKITPDGRAVLVDFGLAKIQNPTQTTTVGAKALTPGFAPPEQYGLGHTDARTDLYSLGATLYTLLTNQVPADSLERAMGQKSLIPIRELNPAITSQVANALEKALAVKPDDRFPSAAEFAAALATDTSPVSTILHQSTPTVVMRPGTGTQPAQPTAGTIGVPPVKPQGNRWLVPVIMIGVVLLLTVGGGAGLLAAKVFGGSQATTTPTKRPTATLSVIIDLSTETPTPPEPSATATEGPPTETPTITLTPLPLTTPQGGGQGQIAFVSERTGSPQIFVMNVDGSNQVQLTTLADGACQPAWSPDGTRIVFVTPCNGKKDQYPRSAIYIMNADGSNVLPFITEVGGAFDVSWSAQSGIAFTRPDNGGLRIYLADPTNGQTHIISRRNSADSQPNWSPDGEKIVFLNTSRAGRPTLYWMKKDGSFGGTGSQPDQVTRDVDASSPAWSPDGTYILFTVGTQLYLAPWDKFGFESVSITTRGRNADPVWSPDGRWIACEAWGAGDVNHDIYLMTPNGSQETRLTDDPALDYQPAWRP